MTEPHQHALIVGAGSGLSASVARLFARAGMKISLAARDAGKLDALAKETPEPIPKTEIATAIASTPAT